MITIIHQCEVEKSNMKLIPIIMQFLNNCLRDSEVLKIGFHFHDTETMVNIHKIIIKDYTLE